MKLLALFCAAVLVVGLATAAYAEVQNVKVSGDLTVRAIMHDDYDLDKDNTASETEEWVMSTTEVQVDADMTDNVSTCVRLVNQRDWDDPQANGSNTTYYDIGVDLAYVTLKELLYSPLTVTLGRQDLKFGKGLVVGAKLRDPEASITADEYTAYTGFDALRTTLDYDPWTIDGVIAIIEENTVVGATEDDDVTLYGANVGYKFDSYNAEAEAYFFGKVDDSPQADLNNNGADETAVERNRTYTVGIRGSGDPIEPATLWGELGYQFGDYSAAAANSRSRRAMALDVGGEYRWTQALWKPKLALEFIHYSGEEADRTSDTGDWNSWDPMYRGKFDTAMREYQNVFYTLASRGTNVAHTEVDQDSGLTNQNQIIVTGIVTPSDSLTLTAKLAHLWFDEDVVSGRDDDIGDEVDILLKYDYTEDVSFDLLAGFFLPGSFFTSGVDDTATNIVGSVAVSF